MAKLRLRSLDGLSHIRKQRRLRMPEGMPRDTWLLDLVTSWRKLTVVEIFRTEWSSTRSREKQIIRPAQFLA